MSRIIVEQLELMTVGQLERLKEKLSKHIRKSKYSKQRKYVALINRVIKAKEQL